MELEISVIAIVVAILLWMFPPTWIQRRLGIREMKEPEPYVLPGIELRDFQSDPLIGLSIREAEKRGDSFSLALRHQVSGKLGDGFEYFRTPDGRKCQYIGGSSQRIEELFLLVKRNV